MTLCYPLKQRKHDKQCEQFIGRCCSISEDLFALSFELSLNLCKTEVDDQAGRSRSSQPLCLPIRSLPNFLLLVMSHMRHTSLSTSNVMYCSAK